jgi:hypothetical protein
MKLTRAILSRLRPTADHFKHLIYFAGLASITYGCWLIYRPAGFIVGGLIAVGVLMLADRESE